MPDEGQEKTPAERRAAMTSVQRLKCVFNIDIETCSASSGPVKVIALIEEPVVIEKILTHLDKKDTSAVVFRLAKLKQFLVKIPGWESPLMQSLANGLPEARRTAEPYTGTAQIGGNFSETIDGQRPVHRRLDHVQPHLGLGGHLLQSCDHPRICAAGTVEQVDRPIGTSTCGQFFQACNERRQSNTAGDPYLAFAIVFVVEATVRSLDHQRVAVGPDYSCSLRKIDMMPVHQQTNLPANIFNAACSRCR